MKFFESLGFYPPSQSQFGHIAAIDGLRAVAVGLVLLFHAGFSSFSGGFIGVDVFFVISGFLITSNILRDRQNGSFSFANFYKRRVARLFPALFVVIILTLLVAFFVLSPDDLQRLGQAGLYSTLSASNIFFWSEAGYFAQASETKPLLHTWSLSVEEQFYLVWPTLVSVLFWIKGRTAIFVGILLLSILSMWAAFVYQPISADAVFFLTPFRGYQFGLGAIICVLWRARADGYGKSVNDVVGLSCVIGLIWIAGHIDGEEELLLAAVLPAILTCVFIYCVNGPLTHRLIASKPMLWLGVRSYSIYLVHWPMMTLWKMSTDFEFSTLEKILAVLLSLVLGAALHKFVERRFRFTKSHTPVQENRIVLGTVVAMLLPVVIASHYWGAQGYPQRIPDELLAYKQAVAKGWQDRIAELRYGVCNIQIKTHSYEDYNWDVCLVDEPAKPTWLVLGDSHASGTYPILREQYPEINFNQLTAPGCRFRHPKYTTGNQMCVELFVEIFKYLKNNDHIEGVVISANWVKGHIYEIEEVVKELLSYNKKVVVVSKRLFFKAPIPDLLVNSMSVNQAANRANQLVNEESFELNEIIVDRLSKQVPVIDILSLQCLPTCRIFDDEKNLLYLDSNHFSKQGFDFVGRRLAAKYPDIFSVAP